MSSEHAHTHEHDHSHAHHTHDHTHSSGASEADPAKQQALLTYMLDHNKHHAEELHDLGHAIGGQAGELIHSAVDAFEQGNNKLEQALNLLKGE